MGWVMSLATLASYHARLGNYDEAAEVESRLNRLSKDQYVSPFYRAVVAAGYGRTEGALAELEAGFATRDVCVFTLMYRQTFEDIVDDPRMAELFDRVGFTFSRWRP
jgi:hypothetical protein